MCKLVLGFLCGFFAERAGEVEVKISEVYAEKLLALFLNYKVTFTSAGLNVE